MIEKRCEVYVSKSAIQQHNAHRETLYCVDEILLTAHFYIIKTHNKLIDKLR